ncbi:MAG TPA: endonuclease MutS2 [Vicinamibacterales bacterium]|nr:endonuclease MutS2 [Vicinamibacterales bacterium]
MLATRTLEFDKIVDAVTMLALTPLGAAALEELQPSSDPKVVVAQQQATSETVRFLERHPLFPLRAGETLPETLDALDVQGRPLEPLQLRLLADFVDSVEQSRAAIGRAGTDFPILRELVANVASFKTEVEAVRQAIDPGGEVLDQASPELKRIRNELRQKRQKLRGTLEQFTRGASSKYLQDEVITERNGRYVLMVRAEHRGSVPGIVHGSSTTGATLFLEPAATVEINNDIVELEDREREEIFRILLELTDRFRARPGDIATSRGAARELDVCQAKARYSAKVNGIEPAFTIDTSLQLQAARHPMLERAVPVDVLLDPPNRVLLITGPNTGGKTVALKTAGLFALMAQAGLHLPARQARLPVFRNVFADIGDEQSIEASLSTFSSHITNLVAMDRELQLPALVLLDEVGTGTDPNEGGALATAVVQHFRQRGALIIATTHFDAVKTWGIGTEGVAVAAFAFDPQNFAPTYKLLYGAPGRSLAIEIAQRLGLPPSVIAAARGYLSDDQKRLQAHLARLDAQARALESERTRLERDKRTFNEQNAELTKREKSLAEREEVFKKRLNERLDERLRQARRDVDAVIDQLKEKSEALVEQASMRAAINTGEAGRARAEARAEIDRIVEDLRHPSSAAAGLDRPRGLSPQDSEPEVGSKVTVGGLGLEGVVISIDGNRAEIDVRGKRIQAKVKELRVIDTPQGLSPQDKAGRVRVNVELRPREGMLSELNVIGMTVDQAVDRLSRFLDDTLVTDLHEVRIVHGHGTGQLRKGLHAFLKTHPQVTKYYSAPENQGGGGATIVELKE